VRFGPAILFAATLAVAQSQPLTTIKVPVRLVTAPTLVFSSDDRLVFGLDTGDFSVLDNGHTQNVTVDTELARVSVVVAVEANQDVRSYTRFMARVGSALDTLLVGERGEGALLQYGEEIRVLKPFDDAGDMQNALRKLAGAGRKARAVDAGMRAIAMLRERPAVRNRVLIFVGQPADSGSESELAELRMEAERSNVAVFALVLPLAGKDFVSDTFSLEGLSSRSDRGGFRAGVDLGRLAPVMRRTAAAAEATDPFSILTAATGGTQYHFRAQRELEDGISLIGVELRSAYLVSYSPAPVVPGYHTIRVEVGVPGAKVFSRPGYWLTR
jgi:VWFA-related protein